MTLSDQLTLPCGRSNNATAVAEDGKGKDASTTLRTLDVATSCRCGSACCLAVNECTNCTSASLMAYLVP